MLKLIRLEWRKNNITKYVRGLLLPLQSYLFSFLHRQVK